MCPVFISTYLLVHTIHTPCMRLTGPGGSHRQNKPWGYGSNDSTHHTPLDSGVIIVPCEPIFIVAIQPLPVSSLSATFFLVLFFPCPITRLDNATFQPSNQITTASLVIIPRVFHGMTLNPFSPLGPCFTLIGHFQLLGRNRTGRLFFCLFS